MKCPLVRWAAVLVIAPLLTRIAVCQTALDQENNPVWAGAAVNIVPANHVGQTFTPTMPRLAALEVNLITGNSGRGADQVTMQILKSGEPTFTTTATIPEGFHGWWRFDLPRGCLAVVPGEPLTIQIKDTNSAAFFWKYAGNNPYPRGEALFGGASFATNDFFFRTFGATTCPSWIGSRRLGVYTLCKYENNWKPDVCVSKAYDPYETFWEIMTAGTGDPHADPYESRRFINDEVIPTSVLPVTGGAQKSWDDFDLTFFYGHNNTIVPPHPHVPFSYWSYTGNTWVEIDTGFLDDLGWGYTTPYDYYVQRPVVDAEEVPAAVTYLFNSYTSSLLGPTRDYGGGTRWREHWNEAAQTTAYGKLGDQRLKWLILNGCQAVITTNCKDGSRNQLAYRIFSSIHGKYHIVFGHWIEYYTFQLKDLSAFAYDLLAGVPIQTAYFDMDPASNSSAISAEADWSNSLKSPDTMMYDSWTNPLQNNPGTHYFCERSIYNATVRYDYCQ